MLSLRQMISCNRFQPAGVLGLENRGKSSALQPVTAYKTLVPCVEQKKSARVANETYIGPGAKHEGNEIGS